MNIKILKTKLKKMFGYFMVTISVLLVTVAIVMSAPVTSPFGWRTHPIYGTEKFHTGVDLGYEYGTPIPSVFSGQVIACGDFDDGYGNQIVIYHQEYDSYTRYAHCSSVTVYAGKMVNAGEVIGYVGSTGNSTGPHLHLEYIVRGDDGDYKYVNPLNIWNYE